MEPNNMLTEFEQSQNQLAGTGQRFVNYLVDIIVIYVVVVIIAIPFGGLTQLVVTNPAMYYLVFFGLFFLYYGFLEGTKGKTVGKMITKTTVVTNSGEPMSVSKALLRTLCRIVPFEFISAFLGGPMWHDKWADTMLVKDN